jgi:hypothetical protein
MTKSGNESGYCMLNTLYQQWMQEMAEANGEVDES